MVNSTITGVVVHGDECGLTTMVKTYQQLLHGEFSTLQIILSIIFAWLWFSIWVGPWRSFLFSLLELKRITILGIFFSEVFKGAILGLAVYCFRRNGVMAPSPEFEPLVQA